MREYETIFVIRPNADEAQSNKVIDKVNSLIDQHNGTILQKNNWGKKEMAYQVEKHWQGVYYYYNYAGDSGVVKDLERSLRLSEDVLKFITVKLHDDVDVEARKREIADAEAPKVEAPVAAPAAPVVAAATEASVEKKVEVENA